MSRKKRILPAAIAVCFILGAGFAYLVYDGYIHVNGPAAGKPGISVDLLAVYQQGKADGLFRCGEICGFECILWE